MQNVSAINENQTPHLEDTLGGRISTARETTGLSTAQLARRLGVKSTTMQNWETDRSEPRSNKLVMLAGLLNVSPSWLLDAKGQGPNEEDVDQVSVTDLRHTLVDLRRQSRMFTEQIDALIMNIDDPDAPPNP